MRERLFHKKKSAFRRFSWPVLALIAAASVGWLAMRGVEPIRAAQAGAPEKVQRASYRGVLRHGGIPLEQLRDAAHRLNSAPVRNTHGDPVGVVHSVTVGPGGRPEAVHVAFGGFLGIGDSVVPIDADKLGYDPTHNVVLTDMTVSELAVIARHRNARGEESASAG